MFSDQLLTYHRSLSPDWELPEDVELLFPFDQPGTWEVMSAFFRKYFNDPNPRTLIFGINPGRFGAGITGTPFTDPIIMEEVCGIPNHFHKRSELSAIFVYEFIHAFGGPNAFYQQFYITSLCPLGFVKNGKNYNYYDNKELTQAVEPQIIHNIETHLNFGCNPEVALCMGKGKNFAYFKALNQQYQFFKKIIPLPHPRWVMQYQLKHKDKHLSYICKVLNNVNSY